eukprot:CCRYP_010565-RB/>CCRYP_010565-RB protein AED:0.04 eAED:0.04 QI:284/1/0.66/1/1/0.66/3/0/663
MTKLRLRSAQQPQHETLLDNSNGSSPRSSPPSSPSHSSNSGGGATFTASKPTTKRRQAKITSTRTIMAGMGTLSFLVMFSGVGKLHRRLAASTASSFSHHRGWDPTEESALRKPRRGGAARRGVVVGGRPPRVTHLTEYLEMDSFTMTSRRTHSTSALSRLYRYLFRKQRLVMDPMLHHDGWKENHDIHSELQETSSTWTVPSFWKREVPTRKEEEEEKQCVPMASWQTTSYPNCNVVHEIDLVRSSSLGSRAFPAHSIQQRKLRRQITLFPAILLRKIEKLSEEDFHRHKYLKLNAKGIVKEEDLTFLGQGWFRSAWKLDVSGLPEYWNGEEEEMVTEESVVLKTLRIERDFLEEYYELHRRDALAMERLTFSPYVLNIYGYCGQSAINELANFGIEGLASLEKIARQFRGINVEPVNKIKLQLASMVAKGVSHMHSIDYPDHIPSEYRNQSSSTQPSQRPNATLVHYDLNPRNIAIVKRGKPKINDFNVAEFLSWDPKRNSTCGFQGRFREPWWRAPEEMHFHDPRYKNPAPLTEKVDIYSLGNILMTILTTHSPRGKMTKELQEQIRPKVARGELPKLPSDFNETEAAADPALSPIMNAMYKCLRALPEDRPSAGEIAEELASAVDNLPEEYGDKEKFYASLERDRRSDHSRKGSSHRHN